MAFQRIDNTYSAGRPVSSALLKRIRQNIDACRAERGRLFCATFGALDSSSGNVLWPRICCFRGRAIMPFIVPLAPGDDEITAVIRQAVPSSVSDMDFEVQCSAFAVPLERAIPTLQGRFPTGNTSDLAASTSLGQTTITIDTSNIAKPGWAYVGVCWESGEPDATTDIDDSLGSIATPFNGFHSPYYILSEDATNVLTGADDVPCMAVFVDGGGKASDVIPEHYEGRQVLKIDYNGSRDTDERFRVYVYPALRADGYFSDGTVVANPRYDTTNDGLVYKNLGYADVRSVALYVSSNTAAPSDAGAFDAGNPAAGRTASSLVLKADQEFRLRTRIHQCGPVQDYSQLDYTGTGPVDRISSSAVLTTSGSSPVTADYVTLAECVVGRDDTFTFRGGATTYTRTAYTVRPLILACWPSNIGDYLSTWQFDLRFKLTLADVDGSSSVEQVYNDTVDTLAVPLILDANSNADDVVRAGYLASFGESDDGSIERHALRGVWPENAWSSGAVRWYCPEFTITDNTTDDYRVLTLAARANDWSVRGGFISTSGQEYINGPRLHLLSWTVVSRELPEGFDDPTVVGAS